MRISDWSSDVGSSDLVCLSIAKGLDARGCTPAQIFERNFGTRVGWALLYGPMLARELQAGRAGFAMVATPRPDVGDQIGRASCRERVCQYVSISVVAVSLTTKTTHTPTLQHTH